MLPPGQWPARIEAVRGGRNVADDQRPKIARIMFAMATSRERDLVFATRQQAILTHVRTFQQSAIVDTPYGSVTLRHTINGPQEHLYVDAWMDDEAKLRKPDQTPMRPPPKLYDVVFTFGTFVTAPTAWPPLLGRGFTSWRQSFAPIHPLHKVYYDQFKEFQARAFQKLRSEGDIKYAWSLGMGGEIETSVGFVLRYLNFVELYNSYSGGGPYEFDDCDAVVQYRTASHAAEHGAPRVNGVPVRYALDADGNIWWINFNVYIRDGVVPGNGGWNRLVHSHPEFAVPGSVQETKSVDLVFNY